VIYELMSEASKDIIDPTAEQWRRTDTKHRVFIYAHHPRRHRLDKYRKHIPTKRISPFDLQPDVSEPWDANASQPTAFPPKYSQRQS